MGNLKKILTTGAMIAGLSCGFGAMAAAEDSPVRGGTLKTISSGHRTLNPGVQSGAATGIPGAQLYAGLVEIGKDFAAIPYLAKSWDVSDGGKTHTFKLIDGATFHDGQPITSADVAFSMKVVQENHPFGPIMHAALESVETPDAHTVVFKHSSPVPFFMQSLAPHLMPIMPKHIFDDGQNMKTHPRNNENVVGSGPFKLADEKKGQYLILERNENFFREGRPYLDKITFTIQKDSSTRLLAFEKGDVDYLAFSGFAERDITRLREVPGITVEERGYEAAGQVNYLEVNLRRAPYNDVRVRQALAHAIDTDAISKILFLGFHQPAHAIVHPSNPLFSDTTVKFKGGVEKANELLDEAGLMPDANGVRFKMVMDVPNWIPAYFQPVSEYLRGQLKKVGVEVTIRQAPDFSTWAKRLSEWDYDASLNGVWNYPDPAIGIHRLYACSNIRNQVWTNTQGYCDEELDALMAKGAVETDPEARKAVYAEFIRKTSEEQIMIYLTTLALFTTQHDWVKNPPLGSWGSIAPWDAVYIDKK